MLIGQTAGAGRGNLGWSNGWVGREVSWSATSWGWYADTGCVGQLAGIGRTVLCLSK